MRKAFLFTILIAVIFLSAYSADTLAEPKEKPESNPSELMETYLGDVVADAMKNAMKTDIALINGGSLGYKNLPDKINKDTLPLIVPFGSDLVVTVKITGADLEEVMEKSMSLLPRRSSSFLQVSGVVFTADVNKEAGKRISGVQINGEKIDPKKEYIVATTDFLAGGGGGLTPFRQGKIISKNGVPLDKIVLENIRYNKDKVGKPEGRIEIILPKKDEK